MIDIIGFSRYFAAVFKLINKTNKVHLLIHFIYLFIKFSIHLLNCKIQTNNVFILQIDVNEINIWHSVYVCIDAQIWHQHPLKLNEWTLHEKKLVYFSFLSLRFYESNDFACVFTILLRVLRENNWICARRKSS